MGLDSSLARFSDLLYPPCSLVASSRLFCSCCPPSRPSKAMSPRSLATRAALCWVQGFLCCRKVHQLTLPLIAVRPRVAAAARMPGELSVAPVSVVLPMCVFDVKLL